MPQSYNFGFFSSGYNDLISTFNIFPSYHHPIKTFFYSQLCNVIALKFTNLQWVTLETNKVSRVKMLGVLIIKRSKIFK